MRLQLYFSRILFVVKNDVETFFGGNASKSRCALYTDAHYPQAYTL